MIFRNGFVSNSSSSSFMININDLTQSQIALIYEHVDRIDEDSRCEDAWTIRKEKREGEEYITGTTWLNNFDMETYLRDIVKVTDEFITWE